MSPPRSPRAFGVSIKARTADHRNSASRNGDQLQGDETGANARMLTWRLTMVTGMLLGAIGALRLAWFRVGRSAPQPPDWSARSFRRAPAREAADAIEELRPSLDQTDGEARPNLKLKALDRFSGASSARAAGRERLTACECDLDAID